MRREQVEIGMSVGRQQATHLTLGEKPRDAGAPALIRKTRRGRIKRADNRGPRFFRPLASVLVSVLA